MAVSHGFNLTEATTSVSAPDLYRRGNAGGRFGQIKAMRNSHSSHPPYSAAAVFVTASFSRSSAR